MPRRMRSSLKKIPGLLWRIPFRLCLLVTLALHLIEEEYPFSNFPMYSNFHNDAIVVWIGDQDGDPIATSHYFGLRCAAIKKILKARAKAIDGRMRAEGLEVPSKEALMKPAAAELLEELWKGRRDDRLETDQITELRFMEQTIVFENNQLNESERELARMPLPGTP